LPAILRRSPKGLLEQMAHGIRRPAVRGPDFLPTQWAVADVPFQGSPIVLSEDFIQNPAVLCRVEVLGHGSSPLFGSDARLCPLLPQHLLDPVAGHVNADGNSRILGSFGDGLA
jgi:hypothetical protein